MSKDHYRNISFSAYIEYDFLDCTGKFAENVLRICSHFMLIFLSPCGLCSRSLCTSLCGGEECTFLVHKVIRNRSIWDPASFWCSHQTHCENFTYLFVWKHEGIYVEEIWKSEEFVWNMWRMFKEKWKAHMEKFWIWLKKWKNLYDKKLEKWRICMETWRIYLKKKWRIPMEKWRIRLDKRKNLYGPTVF